MARNARKAAPEPQPVKTPELIEATFKRMLADSTTRVRTEVTEAKDRLTKVANEINVPGSGDCSLWTLETLGDRLEALTDQSVRLSVMVSMQEGIEAGERNGRSFREVCRQERERMIGRLSNNGNSQSLSAYRNAHSSVKENASRVSLRDAIQTLGWVIEELDSTTLLVTI